ncbi:hypothetical protein VTI74DRAFT_616 [Chaetomium olivicolor]
MVFRFINMNIVQHNITDDKAVASFAAWHLTVITAASVVVATYVFLWALLYFTHDFQEPPLVSSTIPFLSAVMGMVKWSMGFYTHMREMHPDLPIYTLRLPGTRLYIVNSTHLIPVIQRQWRTLIFPPVSAQAAEAALGVSKDALAIVRKDMVTDNGFLPAFVKAIHQPLSSGPALDRLNSKALELLTASLDEIVARDGKRVKLYEWIRHEFLMATTDAVYGPHNPLRDSENEAAWLTYHPTIMYLMLNLLPNFIFRHAFAARNRLATAFLVYHTQNRYRSGSTYIQRWTAHFTSRGIPDTDISRFHIGGLFALTANTIPTAFWTVLRVFSNPSVAAACRDEILRAAVTADDDAAGVCTLAARAVTDGRRCPTLLSVFQEVFRFHGMANSIRVATADHLLDGKYRIRKGGMVMIPARVQHRLREVWGEDVEVFDHRRFLRSRAGKEGRARHNPVAFRGFGGGTTLCPGRHFATTEILVFVAMLLVRFEIVPVGKGGEGEWVIPTTGKSSQAEAMEQPDFDVEVALRPREGVERQWRVVFDGEGEAALVAEDL